MDKLIIAFIRASGIYCDSRATKEIKALIEGGYKVEVIGWDRTGTAVQKCREVFSDIINDVDFHFFNLQITRMGFKNSDKLFKWMKYIKSELTALNKEKKIFAVHACDFDTGYAAQRFAIKKDIRFVYDIFDYYSDSHSMPRLFRKLISCCENGIINKSDVTVICTEERKEQIKNAVPKRVVVIHNSPEMSGNEHDFEKEFDYIYCGTLAEGRLLKEILDHYDQHSDLRMVFGGDGEYAKRCRELDSKYDGFSYVGVIPYADVLELEKKAKCISAVYDPSVRNHRLCAPNKFYEALAVGVPLIVCKGTGIDTIVREHNLGCVIGYDAEEFYQAVKKIISDDDQAKMIGEKSRKIYGQHYKWDYMKKRLLKTYKLLQRI